MTSPTRALRNTMPLESLLSVVAKRSLLLATIVATTVASADTPLGLNRPTQPFVPFSQTTPPGQYGRMVTSGTVVDTRLQAVQIATPTSAQVTVYGTAQPDGLTISASEVFGVEVGRVYRLKLDGMPELPGVEIYPTIELVDRLHPPEGQAAEFPVVIELTADEIAAALSDRLVTKVIYVRPRNDAPGFTRGTKLPTTDIDTADNVVGAAIQRGRPIAVLRLGGRTPTGPRDASFFVGAAVNYPVAN